MFLACQNHHLFLFVCLNEHSCRNSVKCQSIKKVYFCPLVSRAAWKFLNSTPTSNSLPAGTPAVPVFLDFSSFSHRYRHYFVNWYIFTNTLRVFCASEYFADWILLLHSISEVSRVSHIYVFVFPNNAFELCNWGKSPNTTPHKGLNYDLTPTI